MQSPLKSILTAGWLTRIAAATLAIVLALITATHGHDPGFTWSVTASSPVWVRSLLNPNFWLGQLTTLGYCGALWFTGGIFDGLRDTRFFEPRVLRALTRTGIFVILGGLAGLLKFQIVFDDLKRTFGFTAGFTLDSYNIPIAAIGIAMLVLARQVRRLKAELDGFV